MTNNSFFDESETPEEKLYNRYWELLSSFHKYWDTDIDRAIAMVEEARQIGEQLNDPYSIYEADHWLMQALIFQKRDYGRALPQAVKTAVEVRKPQYAGWGTRICIHQDLILSYVGTDPNGYDSLILQALGFMDEQVQPYMQCRFCLIGTRIEFHLSRFELDAARKACMLQLASTNQIHYQLEAYVSLCQIAYLEKKWDELQEFAEAAEKFGEKDNSPMDVVVGLAWQAVAAQQAGDDAQAAQLMRTAQLQSKQITAVLDNLYYNAQVAYYELIGGLEKAAAVRHEQIEALTGKKGWYGEALARIDRCRLLARINQLSEDDIKETEAVIEQLKNPKPVKERLREVIEANDQLI